MLILATGDHHFALGARWAECLRIHDWIAEQIEDLRPNLVVSTGDVFERASIPEERAAVKAWALRVAEVAPLLVVRGNHDRAGDLTSLLTRLRTPHPVVVEEAAGVHHLGGVSVAAFAWPSRASIAAALGVPAGPESVAEGGRAELRRVFGGLGERLSTSSSPRLLVGHAHVTGATVRDEGQPLPFGESVAVGLEDLALAGADATVLGHIHLAQRWDFGGNPVAYTGSPFRNSFGEDDPKSVLAIRFDGRFASLERLPTPATPMVKVEARFHPGCVRLEQSGTEGAEVRLRYEVAAEHRDAGQEWARRERQRLLVEGGALSVRVEEVVRATAVARAPEVALEQTTAGMLKAFWRGRDGAPGEASWRRLLTKVGQLKEGARG